MLGDMIATRTHSAWQQHLCSGRDPRPLQSSPEVRPKTLSHPLDSKKKYAYRHVAERERRTDDQSNLELLYTEAHVNQLGRTPK